MTGRVKAGYYRWHRAPLRTRLTAAAALAATLSIVAVVSVAYLAVRHELRGQIDSQCRRQAQEISVGTSLDGAGLPVVSIRSAVGDVGGYYQVVTTDGTTRRADNTPTLPVAHEDLEVARHGGSALHDAYVADMHFRILTVHRQLPATLTTSRSVAVQIALPLTQVDHQLHKVAFAFLLLALGGLALVIVGSWLVVRRGLRPVATLTVAAEQIAVTRDLTTRIASYGHDELGRLASSFNTMLDALERSLGQQRQLILDASHELRTPLASLRTNVEVLHDVDRLSVEQRRSLLDGIVSQLDELTGLVADVVELARGDVPASALEDVDLDELVSHAVDRARRHWPGIVFVLDAQPLTVRGVPRRLDRAVANLLDNAGKFSPPGAVVDVAVSATGRLTVADRGPGVPEDALPQVFDRFYRSDEARALPGSGLGLAIVKQVVDGHGGSVTIANRAEGGAIVTMSLSPLPRDAAAATPDATAVPQPVGS